MKGGGEFCIVDFERTMPNFIASYDWYHLLRCKGGWYNKRTSQDIMNVPYFDLLENFIEIMDEYCESEKSVYREILKKGMNK